MGCLIKTNQKISRREAIKSAGLLLGVSIPLSQLDILASSFAANKDDFDPQFLGRKKFHSVATNFRFSDPKNRYAGCN